MSVKELVELDIEWGQERLVRAQPTVKFRPNDVEYWSVLLREGKGRHINAVRFLYESLVRVFPTTARYWKIYPEQESKPRNFERVEKLFQRCLGNIPNLGREKVYLTYMKEAEAGLSTLKEMLAQAYDFALEKIGVDLHSFFIWQDFITCLNSVEAVGSYAENQKFPAVRKVYQKAVLTPIIGIEALWKEYIALGQNINSIISKKMGLERSPLMNLYQECAFQITFQQELLHCRDYMTAGRGAKELEIVTKGLNRNLSAISPTFNKEEMKQGFNSCNCNIKSSCSFRSNKHINRLTWGKNKYIAFEKSNSLRIEDTSLITRHVRDCNKSASDSCQRCLLDDRNYSELAAMEKVGSYFGGHRLGEKKERLKSLRGFENFLEETGIRGWKKKREGCKSEAKMKKLYIGG